MSSVREYCIVAAIIAVVLMILGIVSLATPHWVEDTFGTVVGLWEFCSYSSCISFNGSRKYMIIQISKKLSGLKKQ